jgi:CHRD domain-containing protein
MNVRAKLAVGVGAVTALGGAGAIALAQGGSDFNARLTGYQEVPALSTSGHGTFRASIRSNGSAIKYRLTYAGLEGGKPQQAHIHLGQRGVSAGVIVFLCSNLGNGPAGTQPCPDAPATVEGTLRPADVIGPSAQGIDPGEFGELVRAIRAGATYANVHTEKYPGGEIRAQLERKGKRR